MTNGIEHEKNYGFSLMELVVSVVIIGIIIAIAIPMFLNAQDNARQAAVEAAARDAQVVASANILQGQPRGGDLSVLETENVVLSLADTFVRGDESTVCVRADWVGPTGNYAVSGPCDESDTTEPIFDREPDDPLYTTMTYKCPTTRSGYLGILNISDDARVQIWEEGDRDATIREVFYEEPDASFDLRYEPRQEIFRSRLVESFGVDEANQIVDDIMEREEEPRDAVEWSIENTIDNVSEVIKMDGGVTYSVRFDGKVEAFSAPGHRGFDQGNVEDSLADCLVSVDHFGEDTGLQTLTYLGGRNLESVPDNLPETVGSLRGAFENATSFNDENIRNWNTENVYSMQSTFYSAESFNQPLNGWDTSNVRFTSMMFQKATSFNQPLDDWDVSNVQHLNSMFRYASSFNSSVNGWDVSNAENMSSMFRETAFNQPLDQWVPESATNMIYMFRDAPFNQDISHWDVGNVEDFGAFADVLDEENTPNFQ